MGTNTSDMDNELRVDPYPYEFAGVRRVDDGTW
jgi:hypothetical protein